MRTERIAFDLDGRPTTIAEVFAAAHLGGWIWTSLVEPVMEGLACAALAERTGVDLPEATLEQELAAWHLARGLDDAEAAAAWLASYGLDADDLAAYLSRKLLRDHFADSLKEALAEAMIAPDEVIARVPEQAALGGSLRGVVEEAALRMAAGSGRSDTTRRSGERKKLVKEHDLTKLGAREAMARTFGVAPDVVDWLVELEAGYLARLRDVVREDALPRELDLARLPLTVVEFGSAGFDREAEALAAASDPTLAEWKMNEELVSVLASSPLAPIAGAKIGVVLPPRASSEGWMIYRVVARHEPRLTDARVRRAVERRLIDRAFGPELTRRIKFHPE